MTLQKSAFRWLHEAENWHRSQWLALGRKLRGHYGYFAIFGNSRAVTMFLSRVTSTWRRWLNRRSQRSGMTWSRMKVLLQRFPLPTPRTTRPLSP